MNIREALYYCRSNPGAEVSVSAPRTNGMKGPKFIRWNEDETCFEGRRNDDWSTLSKHWSVILEGTATFQVPQNTPVRAIAASNGSANNSSGNGDAVGAALRSLNEGLRLLEGALHR